MVLTFTVLYSKTISGTKLASRRSSRPPSKVVFPQQPLTRSSKSEVLISSQIRRRLLRLFFSLRSKPVSSLYYFGSVPSSASSLTVFPPTKLTSPIFTLVLCWPPSCLSPVYSRTRSHQRLPLSWMTSRTSSPRSAKSYATARRPKFWLLRLSLVTSLRSKVVTSCPPI